MLNTPQRHHRPPFFMKPGHGRPFQRGDFKYIILHYLKKKPSYGYEIMRALQERFHSFYIPSPGTVYPTLQMLEEKIGFNIGYISKIETGKKPITKKFLKKFNDWLASRQVVKVE